jgi:hypothetical protein
VADGGDSFMKERLIQYAIRNFKVIGETVSRRSPTLHEFHRDRIPSDNGAVNPEMKEQVSDAPTVVASAE